MSVHGQQAVLVLEHLLVHESQYWLSNRLIMGRGEQGTSYFCPLPAVHRGMRCKGGTQGFLLICSLSCIFLLRLSLFPVSQHVKPHVGFIFSPSQTLCHKGVDDKLCLLRKKETLWWMMSPHCCLYLWLFWLGSCFLPWCCCRCVRVLYSALLTDICEGCVALQVPFCRGWVCWVCCLCSTAESLTGHLLDRGVQLRDHLTKSVSSLPWQAFCPVWLLHLPKGLSNTILLMP